MLSRRDFLERSLLGSSLIAVGSTVPSFVAATAHASVTGKDNILVILEMTGGNDGLNMVVPYADDLYQKARPTLRLTKNSVIKVDDHIGLNRRLQGLKGLLDKKQLAIVQGVGYPNPNRSHFESMDIWQTADPRRKIKNGWLGRSLAELKVQEGRIAAFHISEGNFPLALEGSATSVPTLNTNKPFGLELGKEFYGHRSPESAAASNLTDDEDSDAAEAADGDATASKKKPASADRKKLIRELAELGNKQTGGLLEFVRKTSLDTYTTIDRLQTIMKEDFDLPDAQYRFESGTYRQVRKGLQYELTLVARMIRAGFGTRLFYLSLPGFDTHSGQRSSQDNLLAQVGTAIGSFFGELQKSGDAKRVLLMTYSEFGRRVKENGSKGTDHGSGSCMFVAGPAVNGGLIGEHPSLAEDKLDSGDLKFHTDFRQVYATLLDRWLECDSRRVLGQPFEHVKLLK